MEQIIDTISALLSEVTVYISDYWLLAAGLGAILLLLLILVIARRRNSRYSNADGDIEFLEVGPEPVIVYRRAAEQEEEKEPEPEMPKSPPPVDQTDPEPEHEQEPAPEQKAEPVPAYTEPEQEQMAESLPAFTEPEQEQMAESLPAYAEMEEESRPEPIFDPEPQPDMETETAEEIPEVSQEKSLEPLPYLESELANNTLKLFGQQGFHIEKIVYQGIFGGDFIAVRPGIRAYVQVKDWKKKVTGNTVAEVKSYANNNDCNQAIIVTSTSFNRAAAKAAARANVSLWNQKSLKKFIKKPFFPDVEEEATANE